MIVHSNLSKMKNKFPTFYNETIEAVYDNSVIHCMVCLELRRLRTFLFALEVTVTAMATPSSGILMRII